MKSIKWVGAYGVYVTRSKAVRDRENRKENTVRATEVYGGVQVWATEYTTGRTEVECKTIPVTNAQRAAYAFEM